MTWIKLHRQIEDSKIWHGKEPFCGRAAWIDLLILASHNRHVLKIKNRPVSVERGQVAVSKRFLMKRWKWGSSKTLAYLALLSEEKMISEIRPGFRTGVCSIYQIVNYNTYQNRSPTAPTNYQTNLRPTSDQPQTETKNIQNQKKGKEDRRSSSSGRENIDRSNPSFAGLSQKNVSEKQKRKGPLVRFREKCESLGLNPFEEYERTKGDITKLRERKA